MYPKNSASPPRIYVGPVVQISDGAVQTSGVSVTVTPEGGSETAGGGTVAYSTKGGVWYTPTQAETNYTAFLVEASKTGCIPAGVPVVTTESATAGRVYVATNGDKAGYALSSAGIQAIWDALTSALTTAGSVGKAIVDLCGRIVGTLLTGNHNPQTGDSFGRIGAAGAGLTGITGATLAAAYDAAKTAAAAGAKMDLIDAPNATAVTAINAAIKALLPGLALTTGTVVTSGGANTASAFYTDLSGGDDFWVGCLILITNGALSGQVKKIGDFVDANGVVTLAASETFTGTPADGVTFTIINR